MEGSSKYTTSGSPMKEMATLSRRFMPPLYLRTWGMEGEGGHASGAAGADALGPPSKPQCGQPSCGCWCTVAARVSTS